jgi:hypothetical protein
MQSLEERVAVLESRDQERKADVDGIIAGLSEVRTLLADEVRRLTDLLAGRPSWGVTFTLTVLSSLVVGLSVALATPGFTWLPRSSRSTSWRWLRSRRR